MAHAVVVSWHETCRYGLIPKVKGRVGRSEINAGKVSPSPGGRGPPGGQRAEGPGRRDWSARLASSQMGLGHLLLLIMLQEEAGWRPRPSQAVGGHLSNIPLLSRSFQFSLFPTTSPELRVASTQRKDDWDGGAWSHNPSQGSPHAGRRCSTPLGCPPWGHLRVPADSAFAGGIRRHESGPRAQRGRVGLPVSVCLHPFVRVCMGIKVHSTAAAVLAVSPHDRSHPALPLETLCPLTAEHQLFTCSVS